MSITACARRLTRVKADRQAAASTGTTRLCEARLGCRDSMLKSTEGAALGLKKGLSSLTANSKKWKIRVWSVASESPPRIFPDGGAVCGSRRQGGCNRRSTGATGDRRRDVSSQLLPPLLSSGLHPQWSSPLFPSAQL